ncbi:MAG: hypothetical protein WHU94_08960 [Thermogemmata sp.]|jgi:hypothetical protein|nr:hypothetical protein [Gemmataceae bacterium]
MRACGGSVPSGWLCLLRAELRQAERREDQKRLPEAAVYLGYSEPQEAWRFIFKFFQA